MTPPQTLSRPLAKRVASLAALRPPPDCPPTPPHVIDAAVDALARGETHYTDRPGIPELRGWVARHLHERWGLRVDPSEVTITCGSTEARYVALTLLTEPGGAALCLGDASLIRGPLQLLDGHIVEQRVDALRLLYLRPDDDRATVLKLLQQAQTTDWWIIWDISFCAPDAFHPAQDTQLAERVVTIDSLSQGLAGWRLGWMAGSAAALRLRAGKQAITICTTAVSQWAGLAWLETGATK
ncbi:MAG: aminotransferase class I/II-fold pyridoxal phosphate-dependent enzyme [Chloroflexi bacterium]|nr:aminotransferase class I/II-fold pyridoxal phosphate-dependent enzyme [Chloroflexota bacterium]MCY3583783.1 aminotransferase class I/II-fold pyridoxal phosphate-dependent enzyme [Chloroflexota bacterium]MCY3716197.1 aminotransferase class I/II-fold pyridoxal phosphate-dependent enzyme [Chloroflexota bacterium]MDE2650848.1 aminotransferase class I/II-fold pyridoxal phosphate-dependent enzyme [Chloroflexota bacterium]MXV93118.1 aminotransferase class I/II-fold pyridoxal phosphate-dependent enz